MKFKKIIISLFLISCVTLSINCFRIKNNLKPIFVINIMPADCDIYYSGLGYYIVEVRDCTVDSFLKYKLIVGFWEIDLS